MTSPLSLLTMVSRTETVSVLDPGRHARFVRSRAFSTTSTFLIRSDPLPFVLVFLKTVRLPPGAIRCGTH